MFYLNSSEVVLFSWPAIKFLTVLTFGGSGGMIYWSIPAPRNTVHFFPSCLASLKPMMLSLSFIDSSFFFLCV